MDRRVAVIAGNLLAPLGVLLFGWNVATAVFLIWLDTCFISLQLGILIFTVMGRSIEPPAGTEPTGAWRFGIGIGMALMSPMFVAPPLLLGAYLLDLLAPQMPNGPAAALFAGRLVMVWVAIQVLLRGSEIVSRARELRRDADAAASFVPKAGYQLLALIYRMVVLMALVWVSSLFGRYGGLVFLFIATALMTYAELHEDWLQKLAARMK